MIARRRFVFALGVTALATPLILPAQQQPKVARIGLLIPEAPSVEATRVDALRVGLRERGYVEGKNIVIDLRSAQRELRTAVRRSARVGTTQGRRDRSRWNEGCICGQACYDNHPYHRSCHRRSHCGWIGWHPCAAGGQCHRIGPTLTGGVRKTIGASQGSGSASRANSGALQSVE